MVKNVFMIFSAVVCLCFGYQACEASEEEIDPVIYKLCSSVEGVLLYYGLEEGRDIIEVAQLTEKQKEEYKNKGLKVITERFENADSHETASLFSGTLAQYYFFKEDTKKGISWSLKAVENGSSKCMRYLANAYYTGNGVVQDLEESVKWKFLGAAAGDEICKEWVKEQGTVLLFDETAALIVKEGQKRAKKWMEAHRELFFTPN